MKQKKIRGHKRRHRQIELWRQYNLKLDFKKLSETQLQYAKIRVHPWNSISVTKSSIPSINGKTKKAILNGLLDIYENWKSQLDKKGEPYYLKMWLCEPRFSTSQVVCAIGDKIEYYEELFFKPDNVRTINAKNYGKLQDRISKLNWGYYLDEDHHDSETVLPPECYETIQDYHEDKKWFDSLLKKPHRTDKLEDGRELYSFKRGYLWVGGA